MSRKKKSQKLNDYANAATAAGMTYGQKQASEYEKAVTVSPVPCQQATGKQGNLPERNGRRICRWKKRRG